ncbi:MAG: hypothetical protein EYC70_15640 [Planctomycetota bacterium]|nr:MAG: hypothetical protein EYC70_15640 [Planctomycetota bacterium]
MIVHVVSGPSNIGLAAVPLKPWKQTPKPGHFRSFQGGSWRLDKGAALAGKADNPGTWTFQLPEGGKYTVESSQEDWAVAPPVVTELRSAETREIGVFLVPAASLKILVCDPDGAPLPEAWVYLWLSRTDPSNLGERAHLGMEKTGPDGIAVFDGLSGFRSYDVLAAGLAMYQVAQAGDVVPGAGPVRLVMSPARVRQVRVFDDVTGALIRGASVVEIDHHAIDLFLSSQMVVQLDFGGACLYRDTTDEFGVARVADLMDANLYVKAEGYTPRSAFVPGTRTDVDVAMTRYGILAGRATDPQGTAVPDAEIHYRIRAGGKYLIEGTVHTGMDGRYELPATEEQMETLRSGMTTGAELFARHPTAGRVDRRVDHLAVDPAKDWQYSELDLVFLPERTLKIHLVPGAVPVAGGTVTCRFAWGHSRDSLDASWVAAPELEHSDILDDDSAVLEGLPSQGDGWFYVQASDEHNRKLLAMLGPVRFEDLDEEWWVNLPQASELGSLEFQLETAGYHELHLQHSFRVRETLRYTPNERLQVIGGRVRIENLLPGPYSMGIDVHPSMPVEIHAGTTTGLGTIRLEER